MGLDGFSIANLGLNKNLTSAQLANEAEATARQSLENQIADVDGIGKKEKVGKKDEDAAFNGMVPFIANPKDEDEESQQQEEQSSEENTDSVEESPVDDIGDEDDEAHKYHFKFSKDNMIEVWDSEKKELIKTISPESATKVFHNFSKVPGIFINSEI